MMDFTAFGHRSITATHKTTVEFTKDDYLTKRGDCILAIKADFVQEKQNWGKIKFLLRSGQVRDDFIAYYNPDFCDSNCMVIRKSDFIDKRTFAVRSNKAAADISRKLVAILKNPSKQLKVSLKPIKIKAVIFDFDNTIEEWTLAQEYAQEKLAVHLEEQYGITRTKFLRTFVKVRAGYESNSLKPEDYGRDVWFRDTFRLLKVKIDRNGIMNLENLYWDYCNRKVRLLPGVPEMVRKIRLKKAVLSDADGRREIKEERMRMLGVNKLFKTIITSNDTGKNKPHPVNFLYAAKKLGVRPEECIMVGDRPETDLICSKELGMTTVLVKHGQWSHSVPYADFEIEKITQLPKIFEKSPQNSK